MADQKLSPAKAALLKQWLQGQHAGSDLPGIPRRPPDAPRRLSFPQQRRLFLEMLDRDTAVNNLSVLLELRGPLDRPALQASGRHILARHETLRTRFAFGMGMPTPEVVPELDFSIPLVDLSTTTPGERLAEAHRLAKATVLQPFDLSQAPLIRLRLYQLEAEAHLLLLVAHHVIADGWSLGVFLKELMGYYQSHLSGRPVQLPALPIQYSDFAYWQTDETRQAERQATLAYWKKKLSGELPITELPTDRPRLARQTFRGGTHRFVLSEDQLAACAELGRQEDATLFMTLLSTFYLLLHRYCGQEDLLIGSPIANRTVPELEPLIGVFINTIVLRANLAGDPSFRELLRQVREVALEAYAHQDLPFEKLVEALKPQRDLNRTPLFQVVFNLQNAPLPELDIAGLETRFLDIDREVAQFDLTLMFSKKGKEYHATVEYNADLFQPATIARMFQSYQQCLAYATTQPDKAISAFPLVLAADQQQLVDAFNRTQRAYPREKCIHQLIEAQVERSPDTVALVHGDTGWTYAELNRRANTLARQLQALGVGPETRVGVLLEKSFASVEVPLAVLKAGGAYVPIHTDSPAERIQYLLWDAEISVLLTNIDTGPLDRFNGHLIDLRTARPTPDSDDANPTSSVCADHLAYIMYTSGSTGTPKGVMMNHFPLVNFLWSMRDHPGMDASSVVLALTALSFDPSTLEVFLPLMVGGRIVVPDQTVATNPLLLAETIQRYEINFLQATPVTWQLLLDVNWPCQPKLTALCGGDILTRGMADRLLERVGTLWNVYGPTETTVWSMCGRITPGTDPITIGRPINNMQVYLLDRYRQPVPVGVIGELHIAGEGLARAYLNRPDLTEQQFIPNPFSSQPGARMYRTGDLARFLPDYQLEILGRRDDQVKVHGNRIELGEISAVLGQHPAIGKSIVVSRKGSAETKRLVAYYVSRTDAAPTADALRTFLGQQLPAYMIPAYFVPLDEFPLLTNGKINRKALPLPEAVRPLSGYVAPRNEAEQLMAKIWQSVLGLEQVGVHDNFFELGGASIQSIQIVAKANMYGYPISVDNIFEFQTIEELVAHLDTPHNTG